MEGNLDFRAVLGRILFSLRGGAAILGALQLLRGKGMSFLFEHLFSESQFPSSGAILGLHWFPLEQRCGGSHFSGVRYQLQRRWRNTVGFILKDPNLWGSVIQSRSAVWCIHCEPSQLSGVFIYSLWRLVGSSHFAPAAPLFYCVIRCLFICLWCFWGKMSAFHGMCHVGAKNMVELLSATLTCDASSVKASTDICCLISNHIHIKTFSCFSVSVKARSQFPSHHPHPSCPLELSFKR